MKNGHLSLLFFGNLVQAKKVCDVKPVILPIKERAVSLKEWKSAHHSRFCRLYPDGIIHELYDIHWIIQRSGMPDLRRYPCFS